MILVDKPYLSDFLKETSKKYNFPIVDTRAARDFGLGADDNLLSEKETISQLRANPNMRIYATSENAIGWIADNFAFSDLPKKTEFFKNKTRFREMMRLMLPNFYFQEVVFEALDSLIINDIPLPFIIKPNVGFFSLGVHKVNTIEDWEATKSAIKAEVAERDESYPDEVLNTTSYIIEEYIEGEEFAFDAYFDEEGAPVILSIFHHLFSSGDDVGDRIYTTSKTIIEENLADFTEWLRQIGKMVEVRNFPVHVEVRRTAKGEIAPIEINPLRFGGWCTTADMTAAAYGFNPYSCYFENKRPNWDDILSTRTGLYYSMIILDNSTGYSNEEIAYFDYDAVLARFKNPLELRKLDHKQFPIFGFLFTETHEDNFAELEWILKADLREFVRI
ncbi:MAG: ATP-grasp domain-containing protein [Chloroflexi bacterium]|nr:ATP-grasp domain-containing protein [Chloroflexota bacterium]